MHHGMMDPRMMCQMCPDRNRVRMAADDAQRILYRLRELLEAQPGKPERAGRRHREQRFHNHQRCHWQGNSCSHFRQHEHELQTAEAQLEDVFSALCDRILELKDAGDTEKTKILQRKCFDYLRGHYPRAAQDVDRLL